MQWIELSKEKPPKEGWYLTFDPTCDRDDSRFEISPWHESYDSDEMHFSGCAEITHWAYLKAPDEDVILTRHLTEKFYKYFTENQESFTREEMEIMDKEFWNLG